MLSDQFSNTNVSYPKAVFSGNTVMICKIQSHVTVDLRKTVEYVAEVALSFLVHKTPAVQTGGTIRYRMACPYKMRAAARISYFLIEHQSLFGTQVGTEKK